MTNQQQAAGLPRNQLLIGDVRSRLKELPDDSVDCIVTSPPYFALRDYGHKDQLGLEPSVEGWVRDILAVASDLKRVLKPTGALWLNLGDSYAHHPREGAPKKSLLLGPSRVALGMVADGWLLRNHVVWAKTNPMPSNVTDRLSNTHETIYFFTKERRYFFDLGAIRQPHKSSPTTSGKRRGRDGVYPPRTALPQRAERTGDVNGGLARLKASGAIGHPLGKNPGDVWSLGTAALHADHFAPFPTSLVERALLSTCPERVCVFCGRGWQRAQQRIDGRLLRVGSLQRDCTCSPIWQPGVVLDPFMGSGTTAITAETQGRDWVGIELNPDYAALAEQRLAKWRDATKS
ncbi:DNA-methyltransferase [Umezawaea tangerina]|uniref:Methyltransferase n=1 Tax=Umezawaea tangerina TaxID=84725 RepID=A0A2T0T4C8_9PSEU|nr:site-specific DNA-methyltransferase [Umezawaea tangerina]PRY40522.1 DNA modification methylase [Umezawaea tangerina]